LGEGKKNLYELRYRMKLTSVSIVALAVGLMLGRPAKATFTLFSTPAGSTVTDGAVNASVSFTTLANEVKITLQNLEADPRSVGQNLSALFFTVDTGQHSGSVLSSSGLERTVKGDGTFVDGSDVAAGWVLSGVGSAIQLDVLSGAGHAGPAHTIIGAPNASSQEYGNANASIAGNGPHNPFLAGPVTFNLSVPGVTAGSKVSTVRFQFGTTDGSNQIAVNQSSTVPEPGVMGVLVVGAVMGMYRRRVG
jgi:hypothetical protein